MAAEAWREALRHMADPPPPPPLPPKPELGCARAEAGAADEGVERGEGVGSTVTCCSGKDAREASAVALRSSSSSSASCSASSSSCRRRCCCCRRCANSRRAARSALEEEAASISVADAEAGKVDMLLRERGREGKEALDDNSTKTTKKMSYWDEHNSSRIIRLALTLCI